MHVGAIAHLARVPEAARLVDALEPRHAVEELGDEHHDELAESLRSVAGTEAAVEARDDVRRTLRAVADLPDRQRAALLAVAVDGRSHAEVAEELGLSDGALRQLVHRARTSLRAVATAVTPSPLAAAALAGGGGGASDRIAELATGAGSAGLAASAQEVPVALEDKGSSGHRSGGHRSSGRRSSERRGRTDEGESRTGDDHRGSSPTTSGGTTKSGGGDDGAVAASLIGETEGRDRGSSGGGSPSSGTGSSGGSSGPTGSGTSADDPGSVSSGPGDLSRSDGGR